MLKTETLSQIDKNDSENKQTEIINGKKQILFFKFDDSSSNQQILPNYLSNISDQVKVGFYSCDRNTQTEQSDILAIGEATHNLIYLCKEIDVVKYDLNFAKNSYQNRFDNELQNKSIEIYGLINQKVFEMKKQHEDNIDRIRKAYKTQLTNAIVKITKIADAKYSLRLPENSNLAKDDFKTQALMNRIKELQRVITEQEINMKSSKEKSDELIERMIPDDNKSGVSSARPIGTAYSDALNEENEAAVSAVNEERDRAYQDLNNLNKKLARVEEALSIKEEETDRLNSEISELQLQIENERALNEQVTREFQDFKNKAEIEKQKFKKEIEKQKKDMEAKMQEKIKEAKDQVANAAKEELRLQIAEHEKKQKELEEKQRHQEEKQKQQEKKNQELLLEQQKKEETLKKSLLEQQKKQEKMLEKVKQDKEHDKLQKEKHDATVAAAAAAASHEKANEFKESTTQSSKPNRKEDFELLNKLKHNEQKLLNEIARLQREIHRQNEQWEKRFDILKHSLHAIKDEMYLRQNLQKQSVNLAYASIAYTMDEAPTQTQQQSQVIKNDSNQSQIKKTILPSIGKNGERQGSSLTVSMPSRLSCQLENDEAQILDDEEMKRFKEEFLTDIDYIIAK